MAVLQCPECPLRFAYGSELEAHLREDHPEFHLVGEPGHHAEQIPTGAGAPSRRRTLLERLRAR